MKLPRLSQRVCIAFATIVLFAFRSFATTLYVDANSTNPVAPYTNWATAANVIQDAVDAAGTNDTVLVTNGVYDTGGKAVYGTMTNRVAVDKALTLLSANGPEFTIIKGYQVSITTNGDGAVRCAYLTEGAILSGFTLTNGATRLSGDPFAERRGGGLWSPSQNAHVSNCVVTGNAARSSGGGAYLGTLVNCTLGGNSAYEGGGSFGSVLKHCALTGNTAWPGNGGGASHATLNHCVMAGNSASAGTGGGCYYGTLNNCLVLSNSASWGGGVGGDEYNPYLSNCTLVGNAASEEGGGAVDTVLMNCIAYFNTAPVGPNYSVRLYGPLDYSCTTPLPTTGTGNITNAPLFVDTNGWADLRLQSNSPCINAGNNGYVTTTNDLDGNPRIVGGTVDMGAYEFQDPQSSISYAYLQQYGLPTDGSVDDIDADGDHATTWQEWKMWTNPTNELSVLKMLNPDPQTNGTTVSWQSVSGHTYTLERAANVATSFTLLQGNITGQLVTTTFNDTTATNGDTFFYRVSVPE